LHPGVDQTGAQADGDIVGRDKVTVIHSRERVLSVVERLLANLQVEIDRRAQIQHTIDQLQRYYRKQAPDGVAGLEAKLHHSGREYELLFAMEMKEQFAKLLERWSLYVSAQELFVVLLARTEYEFMMTIYPQLGELRHVEINRLINDHIVAPTVNECGATILRLRLNHTQNATRVARMTAERKFRASLS
jgi:hypothetical protein